MSGPQGPRIVDGVDRRQRGEFAGNRKRHPLDAPAPKLKLGPHGELTHETIKQVPLSKEEKKLAYEMIKVQEAYLEILESMSYPVDPEGHIHDLTAIGPTKLAMAWTLALCGFRRSGKRYIKKRFINSGGCYADAHTWVDARQPDDPAEELQPQHKSSDYTLPPDTRRLAAIRDGDPGQEMPTWHVTPKITKDLNFDD